ncbi:MAG: hypothetical protein HY026_02780 [Deltaproteobacteria bacterium]|nr:hypothetical protein [Deltaproteobacteria bacterium]
MIANLTNLRSTNNNGSRHVHITVEAEAGQIDATLGFLIHGKFYKMDIQLEPNQPCEVSLKHTETGRCWVNVTDSEVQLSLGKFLDLDAPESS